MSSNKPYKGPARRLVLAFDVGTTYSGVSYCLLDPGEIPKICTVTRYPGQEHVAGSTKIPTVLYYDHEGTIRCAGAEALLGQNIETAEDEGWFKVEWFKVRMRPNALPPDLKLAYLPPLPPNRTLIRVYADFLAYLMTCAEKFIRDTHPIVSTPESWSDLRRTATFVLSHPNGWEGPHQSKLRQAVIMARFVPDSADSHSRIIFVSEGEASLHYCLRGGFVEGPLQQLENSKGGFIIADLGGGTLDFSAYRIGNSRPIRFEEAAASRSELEGSTFVTRRATALLKEKLKGSKYGSDEQIKQISDRFDETTKKTFRSPEDVCLIAFGTTMDKDVEYGIRSGKLKISGEEIASLFKPSITSAVSAINEQIKDARMKINSVYLVGGFAANPYLVGRLRGSLIPSGVSVTTPDGQTAKAVSDGAISYYLDRSVSARIARVTYGLLCNRRFDPRIAAHQRRIARSWISHSGDRVISGAFFPVIQRGTSVSEEREFRQKIEHVTTDPKLLQTIKFDVAAYRGNGSPPEWVDEVSDKSLFATFHVHAENSAVNQGVKPQIRPDGTKYWSYIYEVIIHFGGPEVKAQIAWYEKGKAKMGPAQIIHDSQDNLDDSALLEDESLSLIPAIDHFRL